MGVDGGRVWSVQQAASPHPHFVKSCKQDLLLLGRPFGGLFPIRRPEAQERPRPGRQLGGRLGELLKQIASLTIEDGAAKGKVSRIFNFSVAERAEALLTLHLLHPTLLNGESEAAGTQFEAEAGQM